MPAEDREGLFVGVEDPVVADFVAVVDALLADEIVSSVRREDLADPVGSGRDGDLVRWSREVLASPTRDVGAEDLVVLEADLDLGGEPAAAREAASGSAVVGAEGAEEAALRQAVATGGGLLRLQDAVDDLVVPLVLGDREQAVDRRDAAAGLTHVRIVPLDGFGRIPRHRTSALPPSATRSRPDPR
jgi:hypothetical protein